MVQIAGDCKGDDCPKVFTTSRGSIVVQADQVTSVTTASGEAAVEIPRNV